MIKKLFFLSLVSCSLSACIPAVLVAGGAAAGGAMANDSRSIQTMADDEDMSFQANTRLMADKELSSKAHVSAAAFNHIILLVGQVPNAEFRAHAEQVVQSLPRVRRVYNQIVIGDPLGSFAQSNDIMITANVKTRLLSTSDLKSNHFKVVTEDNTVYLMGLATREQASMAAEVARHSTGVKKVVKIIEYNKE